MGSDNRRMLDHVISVGMVVAMSVSTWLILRNYVLPHFSEMLDPDRAKHEQARLRAQANLRRINRGKLEPARSHEELLSDELPARPQVEDLELNEYENQVAMEVVAPEDIPVGFDDIGGMEHIIEELRESIIYPLTMPHLYAHGGALLAAPSGVLLYGPPGCGKTMLAKAVARESGASFINLHISTMTEKWYGDSNKIVRAVFTLAHKLQPCIVFIDEIDAVLGTRRSSEHEASGMVKAEFMTLWDGLTSANALGDPARIVVLGATNRIHDIDEAILRRMPKKFSIPLPDKEQRLRILELVLAGTKKDPDFNTDFIALVTDGMSGSDIKEACRDAAMVPMREYMRQHRASGAPISTVDPAEVRGLRTEDFYARPGAGSHAIPGPPKRSSAAESRGNSAGGAAGENDDDVYEDVEEMDPEPQD